MLWKKCYASDDKGQEKEKEETQKAEQRIKKESCSTENDEAESQSEFQVIEYAELEGTFSSLWKAQCLQRGFQGFHLPLRPARQKNVSSASCGDLLLLQCLTDIPSAHLTVPLGLLGRETRDARGEACCYMSSKPRKQIHGWDVATEGILKLRNRPGAIVLLGHQGTLLAHVQLAVDQHPQVPFAVQPLYAQPVVLHGVVAAKVEDPVPGLVGHHIVAFSPSIQPVQASLQSPPTLQQTDTFFQIGVICNFVDGGLNPLNQIINKDVNQD
ncbi:hypothetical protein TURU_151443 [Turdus rufiventris]|nr:hypothetical protein TURU_151443 [Turdus rufiventris]